ncbi:MAG: hypothetical protein AABX70_02875, partial [Nanoarchaeota archaeon]
TRDVAEDWIGMGDGCPCNNIDQGIVDKLTPFSGSKHKCATFAKDCETQRYDKCIMGEKGSEVCSIPGRPPAPACKGEDKFGTQCDMMMLDSKTRNAIPDPDLSGFKGVCNRAEQCVPPCEFCPCFSTQAPALCQDPRLTLQYKCLKDEVKSQGVSCSAQQGLCQAGHSCCNADELKDKEREKESQKSKASYKTCLYGLTIQEYDFWQTELKKPGGYDPNNNELQRILTKIKASDINSLDTIWNCLRYAVDECTKKSKSGGWGACQDLFTATQSVLKVSGDYRLNIKPLATTSGKKIQFKLSDENSPFFDQSGKYFFESPIGLCTGVIETPGVPIIQGEESFPKDLMCLNAEELKFYYGTLYSQNPALRGEITTIGVNQAFEVYYVNSYYEGSTPVLCFIYSRDRTKFGKIKCNE